jgi:hypothetical protein
MVPAYKVIPQYRPETKTTRSSVAAEKFDRPDADPLGFRRVFTQVAHDLYGTKDVQDAITASYVWMADQIGHISLGLLPTLLFGWIWRLICDGLGLGEGWAIAGCVAIALAIFAYWIKKERQDFVDTRARAVKRFLFDSADITWNVKTALLYFGIGGALALGALIHWILLIVALILSLWPAYRVAFWWLRRKLAFQQAGLPYLYRLTNFAGVIGDAEVEAVSGLCDLKNKPVVLWKVLFGRDVIEKAAPVTVQHFLITGPLRSGKTSLAVGIGTEFAFALGIGRYLTAAKLMELKTGPKDDTKTVASEMDYDDGRVLWPLAECDLLIVDDVDGGLPTGTVPAISAIRPVEFSATLKARHGPAPLADMSTKRTVWVLGNTTTADEWKGVIADLMDIGPDQIMTIQLQVAPLPGAPLPLAPPPLAPPQVVPLKVVPP